MKVFWNSRNGSNHRKTKTRNSGAYAPLYNLFNLRRNNYGKYNEKYKAYISVEETDDEIKIIVKSSEDDTDPTIHSLAKVEEGFFAHCAFCSDFMGICHGGCPYGGR